MDESVRPFFLSADKDSIFCRKTKIGVSVLRFAAVGGASPAQRKGVPDAGDRRPEGFRAEPFAGASGRRMRVGRDGCFIYKVSLPVSGAPACAYRDGAAKPWRRPAVVQWEGAMVMPRLPVALHRPFDQAYLHRSVGPYVHGRQIELKLLLRVTVQGYVS